MPGCVKYTSYVNSCSAILVSRADNATKNIFVLDPEKFLNRPFLQLKKNFNPQYLITNNNLLFANRTVKVSEPFISMCVPLHVTAAVSSTYIETKVSTSKTQFN
jgi:hypothetical protein